MYYQNKKKMLLELDFHIYYTFYLPPYDQFTVTPIARNASIISCGGRELKQNVTPFMRTNHIQGFPHFHQTENPSANLRIIIPCIEVIQLRLIIFSLYG